MPTVSITEEEWDAICMFRGEAAGLCESADEEYVRIHDMHDVHFIKLQAKYRKAKVKQEIKATLKKAFNSSNNKPH